MSDPKGGKWNRPESYDPRMLEAWRDGGIRETRIPVGPRNKATTMRHRMYKLRDAMRLHGHPYGKVADKAKISLLEEPTGTWCLVIKPVDDDFSAALDAAGYKEETPEPLE